MPLSQALRKLIEAGLLTALTPRPPPQPLPPHFRMDLHCAYHQGLGHETDQCTALRHAIQDLIDQVPPPDGGVISWILLILMTMSAYGLGRHGSRPIELDDIYEMSSMSLRPQVPTPFRLFPETASVHASIVEPPISTRYSVQTPFILVPDVEEFQAPHSDDPQTPDFSISSGERVLRQPPPAAAARPLGASSSTHQDALTRALSQIRVDTTTTPEGLIHMMTAGRATCIVFSDDDLPPEGSGHTRPLYISIGCSGRRVPSVLLDNGSALNTVRAYDSTRREVMGTLEIELLIGPSTFITIFQVLRIPTSFNLLLGRPWIHQAGAIPSSLHQKVKFIHEGQHGSIVVLDMMRDMSYLPGMGLGRRQHGPSEFITIPDHDVPFGLGFIPTEADYLYMARLRKERVRARLTHTPFYYPVRPYTRSVADYFVRASEPHASSDEIIEDLAPPRRPSFSASSSSYD
ncbi:hypothetical protein CK203_044221 [Vitis vinifera]|uniref:Uncharacterized protein n=1 Tax=Vitis vinifera TaxID=29760 RepID=A0A438GVC9_VITVI|nr:hypothetical protein CK203_044221 [Vitis vinifera]